MTQIFDKESDFEAAVIHALAQHGWEKEVLKNVTEQDLIKNWADILFHNNNEIDRLNNCPLTEGEMKQIIEQVVAKKTPVNTNEFINGKLVWIVRNNPDDTLHLGKTISLKIYDRQEIAAGSSRYQIVQQPKFFTGSSMLGDRRGDLMLLINGMPVIHMELKKSGVPVSRACNQIERYAKEKVFTGLFSLIQIFVAMTPEETLYFANPGVDGKFNKNYFFHWGDFNNEPINDWQQVIKHLLSIPMAHQLIGFYTIADKTDGILKVLRSYQYYAANKISDTVAKSNGNFTAQRGGFVWHTTGSGKTMTSFKAAQLISDSNDADKVIFLVDRIELGTQSFNEYNAFATAKEDIKETGSTVDLIDKLKSVNTAEKLIVTSIQKMSRINEDDNGMKAADLETIRSKRLVFIVDECHRSVFGDMMSVIKKTFPNALFFGFTGTPIQEENKKKDSETATIFGNELHRYSIADGIRDKNVLGFDPYKVLTYKDNDLKQCVALDKAKAKTVEEALADPKKSKIYNKIMALPMAGEKRKKGGKTKDKKNGIEDYLPKTQYLTDEHRNMVVQDIKENWQVLSRNGKFHAIFATSSIAEAIQYYRLIKEKIPELKITALFDPSIDNNGGAYEKEEALAEIIQDYNKRYGQTFTIPLFAKMKKDIAARLAHKEGYKYVQNMPDEQLDLLVVVDQMLTGFDSKWVNTLYLDKLIKDEEIIQAFSRTNRLFGEEKPFGVIRYYRKPHTMEKRIEKAVKLYAGDKPLALFVDRLQKNLVSMNAKSNEIKTLFHEAGINDFSSLPQTITERKKFAVLFNEFNSYLQAAVVQGFNWDNLTYEFAGENDKDPVKIEVSIDEITYNTLLQRYKELYTGDGGKDDDDGDAPYEIDGYLATIDTGKIDNDYMNLRFTKYLKAFNHGVNAEEIKHARDELLKTFAMLNQQEQKFAERFLRDIQSFDIKPEEGKTFRDYITEYMTRDKNKQIRSVVEQLGIDEEKLKTMLISGITETNINEYSRFEELKNTADKQKAKAYFESVEGEPVPLYKVTAKIDTLLRDFILKGGVDIPKPNSTHE